MAYDSIPDAWRDIGKAVKKDLVDRIHNNLEDLNDRVTNVEGSVSTSIIANQSIKKERDNQPLGAMVWSPLASSDFTSQVADGGWQLCDGTSVAGSDYAVLMSRSTVPDLRGKFMRMRAHGTTTTYNADGDVATDTVQAASIASHTHVMNHGHSNTFDVSGNSLASAGHRHLMSHVHQWAYQSHAHSASSFYSASSADSTITTFTTSGTHIGPVFQEETVTAQSGSGSVNGPIMFDPDAYGSAGEAWYTGGVLAPLGGSAGTGAKTDTPDALDTPALTGAVTSFAGSTSATGSGDTRPANVTEECYIKINKNYIVVRNGYLLWRAPQAITINQVVLTPVTQGTSGTLTIDVKKGPLTSISTSIFTTAPNLVYTDTTAQTGTINPTNATVAAGEYVRLDITATQAKLQEFHVLIAATPT